MQTNNERRNSKANDGVVTTLLQVSVRSGHHPGILHRVVGHSASVDVVVVDLNTPRDKLFIPGSLGAGRKEMIETSWKQLLLTSAMLAACKQTSSPALHPPHIKSQAPQHTPLGAAISQGGCGRVHTEPTCGSSRIQQLALITGRASKD